MRVLIADDCYSFRTSIALYVIKLGHEVLEVDGGAAALAAITAGIKHGQNIHAVITDIEMPGGNGLELVQKISFIPTNQRPMVYVHSGGVLPTTIDGKLCAGKTPAVDYPFASFRPKGSNTYSDIEEFLTSLPRR